MSSISVQIEISWKEKLREEFEKPYFQALTEKIKSRRREGKIIYPPGPLIFNAFCLTPFDKVKVVIIGQDPYHNPGEAMGLSFSVPKGVKIPPSLKNIYKELNEDLGVPVPNHGDLTAWARQGVFLLNAMLTVEENQAGSHKNVGWQTFTDAVIHQLSLHRKHIVFLLWGNFAKGKKNLIDGNKHLILEAVHPSPLAGGAFFGCKHFSKTNEYLLKTNQNPVDWSILS
jgi:uracil-DNA glycosylase